MRVTMVVPEFPRLSESFLANQFAGILSSGGEASVVCTVFNGEAWKRFPALEKIPGAARRVILRAPLRPRWLAALRFPSTLAWALRRNPKGSLRYLWRGSRRFGWRVWGRFYADAALVASRPAVVHFEFGTLAAGNMYLRELLGAAVLVSFRGFDLNFAGLDRAGYYEDVWREADRIHCLGEDLWRRAQRRGCPPDKPHVLIAPAIDAEFFAPSMRREYPRAGSESRPLRILSVARLEWKKGYEFALEAVARLRARGVKLEYRIAGGGEQMEALTFCREQLGLRAEVEFLGPLPAAAVREQLEWADVFLHLAVSEGFCNAVLEAQAMGVPAVVSDADGLTENVSSGATGFVVPRRDPGAAAARLEELTDGAMRRRMGEAGRERVVSRFRLEDQTRAFDRVYQDLAASVQAGA